MSMPVTALDERFSDPKAVATGWDETRRALDEAELFWITTVRPDGRPHVTPLVAVWLDGALYFCTGDTEQKAVNLAANPHVILTTGCNRWDGGLDVVLEGDAVQVTDDDLLRRLAEAWRPSGTGDGSSMSATAASSTWRACASRSSRCARPRSSPSPRARSSATPVTDSDLS